MAFETKPNTGSAFRNDKRTKDTQPNYTGNALIGGTSYFVDAWINVAKSGDKYISLKFKEKDQQRREEPRQQQRYGDEDPF